jgi:uncharacterized protein YgfB (UPF0149 family)
MIGVFMYELIMPANDLTFQLPEYQRFNDSIAILALPISGSELHGVLCGYLTAGESRQGENYLRALTAKRNGGAIRSAALALFNVFTISQQQITQMEFDFQLLLPAEWESLTTRAKAFSEWCEGFTQGITMAGVSYDQLQEDDAVQALQHITEFANLDYKTLHVDEEDEQALMEVCEYTRMAVLHIYSDLQNNQNQLDKNGSATAH